MRRFLVELSIGMWTGGLVEVFWKVHYSGLELFKSFLPVEVCRVAAGKVF